MVAKISDYKKQTFTTKKNFVLAVVVNPINQLNVLVLVLLGKRSVSIASPEITLLVSADNPKNLNLLMPLWLYHPKLTTTIHISNQ